MANFIKYLFGSKTKKNKKMEVTEASIEEAKRFYSNMQFEWVKGEEIASREDFKDLVNVDGDTFVLFQSGKRINTSLLEEYMVYYPAQPKQLSIDPVPINADFMEISKSTVTSIVYNEEVKQSKSESPIYKLLNKQKKNIVEVSIKLKLNLPPKELYGVLSSSFDDAEKEIIEFVLDGIDIDDIKKSLSDSIRKGYYNLETKSESTKPRVKQNKSDE
jgi:hypothetical protein